VELKCAAPCKRQKILLALLSTPDKETAAMAEPQVAYAQDEYGRPFIVVREQGKKTRAQGIQALKNHISVSSDEDDLLCSHPSD
jgi:phosphopantetheinyl transferase (holo-ACP synthase)